MDLTYLRPESVITVAGTKVFVTDPYDGGKEQSDRAATSATVVLGLRGDEGGGLRELATSGRGERELQLKAEAATAHDLVRLKRLQQQVAIAEAAGSLEPATELAELTYELELLKVRKEIETLVAD